jgi:hypothetical protein
MSTAELPVDANRRLPGVTALLVAQTLLIVAYYVGVGGLYLIVSAKTGWQGWLGPENDPKDHWPAALPLLYLPVALAGWAGYLPAALLALLGGANLARPEVRAQRRQAAALAVTTVLCAAMVVLIFTPLGQHVHTWMLD